MAVFGWIQSVDFSTVDLPEMQDARQAIWQLNAHNWAKETEDAQMRTTTGDSTCPAGIGFHTPDNREILHICPDGAGEFLFFFTHTETYKVLGLIPREKTRMYENQTLAQDNVEQLITWFFAGDFDAIIHAMSY